MYESITEKAIKNYGKVSRIELSEKVEKLKGEVSRVKEENLSMKEIHD